LRVALQVLAASFIAFGLTLFTSPVLAAEYNVGDPCPAGFPDGMKHQKDDGSGNGITLVCDGGTFVLNTEITGTKTLLQIGNDADACTAAKEGRLRYDPGGDTWEYCDSAGDWRPFGYCSSNLSNGLAGHWPFDDGSGTTAIDVSGNGNDGTLQNMDPATDWVTGVIGSHALDFDGVDDDINVPDNGALTLTDTHSISLWARFEDLSSKVMILDKWKMFRFNDDPLDRWEYQYEPSGGGASFHQGPSINTGQWYHTVVTYEEVSGTSYIDLYVDGALVRSLTGPLNSNASGGDMEIASGGGGGANFNGQLDDIRIYDRVLSDCEVQALYLGL
jgi:hypothetical protein